MTTALERMEIETAACTSSVRVSRAFARESGYRDAMDGDHSTRDQNVCESSYHGSGTLVQNARPPRRPLTGMGPVVGQEYATAS